MTASTVSQSHVKAQTMTRIKTALLTMLAVLSVALPAQAQYTPAPYTLQQYFDNAGDPLSAGGMCVFAAGTSTLATTYTTATGGVANANPIRFNSTGRPSSNGFFLVPGVSYKLVLKDFTGVAVPTCVPDTGVTIWTQDNIDASPASSVNIETTGTAGVSFLAGELGYMSDGSGGLVAGNWYKADADFTYASTTTPQIAFAVNAITAGFQGSFRLVGTTTGLVGLTPGFTYYVSATAGGLTATAPSNARLVGQANTSTSLVAGMPPQRPTNIINGVVEGRLTLTTGLAVTVLDVTAATTVFYTPYTGNQIALYDGISWNTRTFTQLSVAVPATTAKNYDVFIYESAQVPTIELSAAWNTDSARFAAGIYATALPVQDGVYVKSTNGTAIDATRRYVGSFRTTAVSGQTEDSGATNCGSVSPKRYVYNYYNRVDRALCRTETTDTWNYTLAAFQQANASALNQVEILTGVREETLDLVVTAHSGNTNASIGRSTAIGENSVTTPSNKSGIGRMLSAITDIVETTATFHTVPVLGLGTYAWLESSTATGTTTWYGDNGGAVLQSGMFGSIRQ